MNILSNSSGRALVLLVGALAHASAACGALQARAPAASSSDCHLDAGHTRLSDVPGPDYDGDDPLLTDAREIAKDIDMPIDDLYRYLSLQEFVGVLGARLEQEERATFGGLYLDYGPPYRIVILSTSQLNLEQYYPSALDPIRETVECREVEYTYNALVVSQNQFAKSAPDVRFESSVDVRTNRVVLRASSEDEARVLEDAVRDGDYVVPAEAFVVEVGPLAQPG